ncbi:MAG: WYL domain-containing protein [Proteobacteria bacterium]|nr:WYL domain-containing protein [Pseudomonadota bacterium]
MTTAAVQFRERRTRENTCLLFSAVSLIVTAGYQGRYFLFISVEMLRKLLMAMRGASVDDKEKKRFGKSRESSMETVRRILFLFSLLRNATAGRKLTAQEALRQMHSKGYSVSERTVQKYLNECSLFFAGVRRDESKPIGWWWEENTIDDTLQLSKEGALALCLAEAHLKHLIPSAELKHLAPLFEHARGTIKQNRYKKMLERIWITPRGLQLKPPKVDRVIFDQVMTAILDSTELEIDYKKSRDDDCRQRIIRPHGMVERSGLYYIVGPERYSERPKTWALHRIQGLRKKESFSYDKNFRISDYSNSGGLNVKYSPERIGLHLIVSKKASQHLLESSLSSDQTTEILKDGSIVLRATVDNTIELRWWIMGFAHECEVAAPAGLREEIHDMLLQALNRNHCQGRAG